MENFLRKPIEEREGKIVCQITNIYGENWAEDDDSNKKYRVIIFGVTENSESVGITVSGFCPYFYICVPAELQQCWNRTRTKYLESFIRKKMGYFSWALESAKFQKKKKLFPFTNFEEFKFVKLTFSNTIAFHVVKKYFYEDIKIQNISVKPFRYELYESNIDPLTRFTQRCDILTAGWIYVEDYQYTDSVTKSQIDIQTTWKKIHAEEREDIAPLVIASFDIETYSDIPNTFPNSQNENHTVAQIGTTLWKYGTDEIVKHIVTLNNGHSLSAGEADFIIEGASTEKELFQKWVSFINSTNPDGYTGYNIFGYDWKYMADRDKWSYLKNTSRIYEIPSVMEHKELKSSAYGVNTFDILQIPGVFQVDLYTEIRRNHKLESYSLNNVALHFTKQQKDDMPYMELFKKLKGSAEDIWLCAKYCVQDTFLVIELIRQLKIIPNLIEMAKVTRVPIDWLITRGQQIKVFNQIAYSCSKKNFCVPIFNSNRVQQKYVGATVLNANIGAYMDQAVAGLDFASLYPSIMIAHKLCYSTFVSDDPEFEKYKNIEGIDYEVIEWEEEDGSKFKYTFVQNTESILPDLLDTLWKCRKVAKRQMKDAATENEKAVYNGKQLAIKVTMNSIYGFTGADNGMLPLKPIAASTTTYGRKAIEHSKNLVEEAYDATVCYGDSIPANEIVTIRSPEKEVSVVKIMNLARNWIPYRNFKPDEGAGCGRTFKQQAFVPEGTCAWTASGWSPIRRVIRHRTNKKLYRITTKKGMVVVTEDHSLLTEDKKLVTPGNLTVGTKLLHKSFSMR